MSNFETVLKKLINIFKILILNKLNFIKIWSKIGVHEIKNF